MILPDLFLPYRANCSMLYNGIDSVDKCLDKEHFNKYPYDINYKFNPRGFRDDTWPAMIEDLRKATWCIGDSFTVGVGQPFDHIWPQVLQQKYKKRTISVAMDGASNDWISRRALKIVNEITPKNIVIMWSYFHRRESSNIEMDDERRRLHYVSSYEDDIQHFLNCLEPLQHINNVNIIHSLVPRASCDDTPLYFGISAAEENKILGYTQQIDPRYTELYSSVKFTGMVRKLDVARDGHHFGFKTSKWVVDQILPLLLY